MQSRIWAEECEFCATERGNVNLTIKLIGVTIFLHLGPPCWYYLIIILLIK